MQSEHLPNRIEYPSTKERPRWRDEMRAFVGTELSNLTPERGVDGKISLQHLPGQDGGN